MERKVTVKNPRRIEETACFRFTIIFFAFPPLNVAILLMQDQRLIFFRETRAAHLRFDINVNTFDCGYCIRKKARDI